MHKKTAKNCTIGVGLKQMYDNLARFGFEFGPTFRTLNAVSFGEIGEGTASINSTTPYREQRSIRQAQRAVDFLLSKRRRKKKLGEPLQMA
jgi:hypothetical protein